MNAQRYHSLYIIYYFLMTHHVSDVGHRLSWITLSSCLFTPLKKKGQSHWFWSGSLHVLTHSSLRGHVLQNQTLYCCLNRWLSVTFFSATHHNMRNDTGEREAVPCLTVQPETKFKLFLQLRDTVKNIFLSSKQKKKSSLWSFIFLQHCVQNVPKMNKSEIKHAHCITRTPVRAFTWGEWIVVLGISAVIYFIQTHLNWNILKWELWSGRFLLVRATVVTTVCCVCFGHIVTTQVCFLFFFREPQISSLCFFYHVLNLLDWFAFLATKTFSSKLLHFAVDHI